MLQISHKKITPHYSIAYARVNYNVEADLFDLLHSKNIDLRALKTIKNQKRRVEWLSVRYLLTQLNPEFIDIIYDRHGKPHLKGQNKNLSISHSYEMISVGIHENLNIGIDIQRISEKVKRIKNKFLNPDEIDLLKEDNPIYLTLAWSMKEALFKVYGVDDIFLKENIRILSFAFDGKNGEAYGSIRSNGYYSEYKIRLELIEGYVLAYLVNS